MSQKYKGVRITIVEQIGYQMVFFWEYFGPLAIYPLFYFLPSLIYGR